MHAAPARQVALGAADVEIEHRADGSIRLRSPHPLSNYPVKLTERLVHWARERPAQSFIAQRDGLGGWRSLTYAEALRRVRAIGQALLDRGLSQDRPLAILSDNDIEHALLALACMHVGIAYVPVSSAYSLVSTDYGKLKHVIHLLTPGLVYASDGDRFAKAIAAAVPAGTEVVLGKGIAALESTAPTPEVDAAHDAVGPDTIAKFLLTSGSTGQPKAVVNTQRMLCSNQQMLTQSLPSLGQQPPVLVDWLPWNHTAGSNHNLGKSRCLPQTFYQDLQTWPAADSHHHLSRQPRGCHACFNNCDKFKFFAPHNAYPMPMNVTVFKIFLYLRNEKCPYSIFRAWFP